LHPTGTTALGRQRHDAFYDVVNDRMLVFGGSTWFDYSPNLWELAWNRPEAASWVRLVSVETGPLATKVAWAANDGAGTPATIERSDDGHTWRPTDQVVADNQGTWTFEDARIVGRTAHSVRLVHGSVVSDPVAIAPYHAPAPGLELVSANPVLGSPTIRFTLESDASAQLEVFSVTGRWLAGYEVGALGAGSHVIGLQNVVQPLPGLYFVRLTQSGFAVTKKIVIVH
jgi:hypothetical protein